MGVVSSRSIVVCVVLGLFGTSVVSCRGPARRKEVRVENGVEIVSNPAVPLSRDHGRVLKLRRRLRLEDTGDTFYFKYPGEPNIAPDGSIFIRDEGQLLRFSPDGAFLGNLWKQGQGPGEIESLQRLAFEGDQVYAFDGNAYKIVRMTLDGRWIDDLRLDQWYEAMTRNWFVGSMVQLPKPEGELADATYTLHCAARAEEARKRAYVFTARSYREKRVFLAWDKFLWVPDAARDLVFISRSREYGVELLDLNEGRVTRSFKRAYPKVDYVVPDNMRSVYGRPSPPPRPEFESDILGLFLCRDRLWVRTSTQDAQNGILFDVFNDEGDFLDSFYVKVQGSLMDMSGGVIFVKETNEAGEISIVLYDVVE